MADRRGALIPLLIITWIFLSPTPQYSAREINHRARIEDVIEEEQRSLEALHNSSFADTRFDDSFSRSYGDLNLTGFEEDRGYAWDTWPRIRTSLMDSSDWFNRAIQGITTEPRPVPLYNNVTGYARGKWTRSPLQQKMKPPHLNLTDYVPDNPFGATRARNFGRNITGDSGDVRIEFTEKPSAEESMHIDGAANITELIVELKLWEDETSSEHEVRLRGVYFMEPGYAVLTTTSSKFAGIFALPHFTPTDYTFNLSRTVLNQSISKAIQRQIDRSTISLNPWSASSEGIEEDTLAGAQCELVVVLRQYAPLSVGNDATGLVTYIEHELQYPSGTVLPPVPDMNFHMIAFSPDCGYIINSAGPPVVSPSISNHLNGPKTQVLSKRGMHHLLVYMVILVLQTLLLQRQMRESSTPSTRSRISLYTIAGMALGDGFVTLSFTTLGSVLDGMSLHLMSAGFLAFMGALLFGMRFLMDIWSVQAPELRQRERVEVQAELRRREEFLATLRESRERRQQEAAANAAVVAAGPPRDDAATPAVAIENAQEGVTPAQAPAQPLTESTVQPPSTTEQTPATTEQAPEQPLQPTAITQPGTLPLPVTAQRPNDTGASPVFYMPSDQGGVMPISPLQPLTEEQQANLVNVISEARIPSFGSLYARFFFLLIGVIFLSLNAASWPSPAQRVYYTTIAFLYLSFWVPQINRNVRRNCRRALDWDFVLGESALRIMPFAYFFAYRKNVLFAQPNHTSLAILVLWQWIQVVVLASQEILGPRWFLPGSWLPPAYDYHPILRADAEGSTLPLGLSTSTAPASPDIERRGSITSTARRGSVPKETKDKGRGKRVFDCAICMQDLEVPVIEADDSDAGKVPGGFVLARRQYMVTPCRHIFHAACLEGWIKYRLQCPICREGLPPL